MPEAIIDQPRRRCLPQVACFELQSRGTWTPARAKLLHRISLVPLNPIQNVTFPPVTVVVSTSSPATAAATGVRYAYADAPGDCNVYSSAGLPAGPLLELAA